MPVGSTRFLTATVAADAGVDHVEFYYDGTLVGSDNTAPYNYQFTAPDSIGTHQFTATVIDLIGRSVTSNGLGINIVAANGVAPTVSITSPASGAFVSTTGALAVTGTAADSDGSVTSVQLFANGALMGSIQPSGNTWSINWTPSGTGTVSLIAVATDNQGNAVASPPLVVNIADTNAPGLTLGITPAAPTLPAGAVRNIVAGANATTGRAIVRVEFFVNGTKVSEDDTSPYTYRFTAPATLGTYVVTARATDNAGSARDAQQTFTVISAVGSPPTINLVAPVNNSTVVPNSPSNPVSLAAAALATGGGSITSVQFYQNGSPVGNPLTATPYTTTYAPPTPGTYVFDAIATDDRGNTAVSNISTVTAAFGTPTISITSPNSNATARATPNVPFTITATAVGGTGAQVLLVEFLLDGNTIGTATTPTATGGSSYSFKWTPTTAQLGTHQLTARVTDTNSLTATSAQTININVANAVGTPPTVAITSPANNAVIQSLSQVNITASSSPGSGATISSVEFFLNDVSIGTGTKEQSSNTYRRVYDFSTFDFSQITPDANGRYPVTLYAIAKDSNGNQTVSTVFTLSISPSTSAPPTVSLLGAGGIVIGPGGGVTTGNTVAQGTAFILLATSNDTDGVVTSLQLLVNGVASGAALANPANQATLTYTPTSSGNFNLYVVATDDTGNTAISTPAVVLTVTATNPPTTALTRPSDDSTVTTVGAPVFLEATASGSNATQIPAVTFIATNSTGGRTTINATRVGTTSTYRAIWTPTTADTYTVVSAATVGNASANSTSSHRVVVSNVVGLAPTISISVPTTSTTASSIVLTATAADSDGSIASVEFFLNRISVGKAVRDQLTNTWRLVVSLAGYPTGATECVALATDSSGNVVASSTTNITINAATGLPPSIASITASPTTVAFSRQVQLTANARDLDSNTVTVQYFANGTSIGSSSGTTGANTNYLVNWTPTASGTYNVYAVATDTSSNTAVAPDIQVTVNRNQPVLDDTSFILQAYTDIANQTLSNSILLGDISSQMAAGTLTRGQLVANLATSTTTNTGFNAPTNLLAAYYVIMGQWPTPANYQTLLPTARTSLANAIGAILTEPEYVAKYPEHVTPTVALLNNPKSAIPAATFLARLFAQAGLGTPSDLDLVRFENNDTASATIGRGYNATNLNTAIAEFITNTNSTNTTLFNLAKAAAIFYQIDRPGLSVSVDDITAHINAIAAKPDLASQATVAVNDVLYTYRFVTITSEPQSLVVNQRSGAIFSVTALGAPPIAYQWLFNGALIAGATNSTLNLTNVDGSKTGTYSVVVTTPAGASTSDPATLKLTTTTTRLINISTRGMTNGGAQVLIGGFVVAGPANQTRTMLIRVSGPALAAQGLTGTLADPRLEVYDGTGKLVLSNDNWGTQATGPANAQAVTQVQQAAQRVGAFDFPANSNDAALLATLPPGNYTVMAKGPAATSSGVVLLEVYDATPGVAAATNPRAVNVSTRGQVATGSGVMIAGFVINGAASRRVLIRGVGPSLARFGVTGILADPTITLNDANGNAIKTNDDWGNADDPAAVAAAAATGGAFPLNAGSKDAAMLVMLAPGNYTVVMSGTGNTTGIGLVEVYDVDP